MLGNYFLFLTSKDSLSHHPTNSASDFTVQLSQKYFLGENWEVALVEVQCEGEPLPPYVIISCDLCSDSYIRNSSREVLRTLGSDFEKARSFSLPYYVKVSRWQLDSVRIRLLGADLREIPKLQENQERELRCVLHIRHHASHKK